MLFAATQLADPQGANWILDIIRSLLGAIDWAIYSLIKFIIQGIFDLSNITASSELVGNIYNRIYVFLGVFMVFKLTFSFFGYILDPDSMVGNKEKGVGKLLTNTIVMLMMLVAVPNILFGSVGQKGLLYRAQNAFLPMLPRILLGIEEGTGVANMNDADGIAKAAENMAVTALTTFFQPADVNSNGCSAANKSAITTLNEFISNADASCKASGSLWWSDWIYFYNYTYLLSTVVGVLMIVILAGITLDVAKRVFKLFILQLIAPIPIMSYIDPKSSKDGAFASWIKMLISTFIELFLKLGLIYLILMLINALINEGGLFSIDPNLSIVRKGYLYLLLIIGLLFFAREAPKFIKDALGIKDSGGGGGFMGSMAGMLAGAGLGAAGGLVSGGLAGAATGLATGASAGFQAAGSGKPSNAFRAGGDAALQARLGDPKAKSGILNNLSRRASHAQAARSAQRYGLTEDSVKGWDDQAKAMETQAAAAEAEYRATLESGGYTTTEAAIAASNRVEDLKTRAAEARKTADKASKMYESFGLARSGREKMDVARANRRAEQRSDSGLYRAARSARDTISNSAVGNATRRVSGTVNDVIDRGVDMYANARYGSREAMDAELEYRDNQRSLSGERFDSDYRLKSDIQERQRELEPLRPQRGNNNTNNTNNGE